MKLFNKIPVENQLRYLDNISNIASLSMLFTSDTSAPYLVSRSVENIYCKFLNARNLGRDDIAIDAIFGNTGIGIKTFLHNNGNTLQKIAEFNKSSKLYSELPPIMKITKISQLRNDRLQFVENNYKVTNLIYHCITRNTDDTVNFYEIDMDYIDINNIRDIVSKQNSIFFNDGKNEYSFNLTKSTLFMRFPFINKEHLVASINVNIIDEPYELIDSIMPQSKQRQPIYRDDKQFVILPLYSFNKRRGKFVAEKSGLNQWNASGRSRDYNEVYIPISSKIHRVFPAFFPPRNVKFYLRLPNQESLLVKVCQDGSKALMSDPNRDLGKWLLRNVLRLKEGTLLNYEMLENIGVESVKLTKLDDLHFEIEFMEIGSYDVFALDNNF